MSKTIEKNDNANNDNGASFKERIGELESENDLLKAEIATLQRLIWRNFEDLIDSAYLLRRLASKVGEQRYQKIFDDYMRDERPALLTEHKQKAIKELYILDFTEVYELLSEKISDIRL